MPSPVGDKRAVKIFVLYLLENINYPLELFRISDIVMQTDYVLYLDFVECFNEMTDAGLVAQVGENADGDALWAVTDRGRTVAGGLRSELLPSLLDKALAAALRYLDFSRRGISAECDVLPAGAPGGECEVRCRITEKKKVLMEATLRVDSLDRAERMRSSFLDRPEVVFRGFHALLAGNMNYLFDGNAQQ